MNFFPGWQNWEKLQGKDKSPRTLSGNQEETLENREVVRISREGLSGKLPFSGYTQVMFIPLTNKEQVEERLRAVGIIPTRQRVEIGLQLFDRDKHITADQLLELVNTSSPEASKATIYNTLGLFAGKGLIREVIVDPQKLVYDTNTSAHHHIYNVDTGELSDVSSDHISISELPELHAGVEIEAVDIVIRVRNQSI